MELFELLAKFIFYFNKSIEMFLLNTPPMHAMLCSSSTLYCITFHVQLVQPRPRSLPSFDLTKNIRLHVLPVRFIQWQNLIRVCIFSVRNQFGALWYNKEQKPELPSSYSSSTRRRRIKKFTKCVPLRVSAAYIIT